MVPLSKWSALSVTFPERNRSAPLRGCPFAALLSLAASTASASGQQYDVCVAVASCCSGTDAIAGGSWFSFAWSSPPNRTTAPAPTQRPWATPRSQNFPWQHLLPFHGEVNQRRAQSLHLFPLRQRIPSSVASPRSRDMLAPCPACPCLPCPLPPPGLWRVRGCHRGPSSRLCPWNHPGGRLRLGHRGPDM